MIPRVPWLVILFATLLSMLAVGPARASEAAAVSEAAQWSSQIREAVETLRNSDGDNLPQEIAELERVRGEIAAQRDIALAKSRRVSPAARILERKLALIGSPPAEGGYEPTPVTERRLRLERALEKEREPQRLYEDHYLRAVLVVEDLDRRIAALTRQQNYQRSTSPLLPSAWTAYARETSAKWQLLAGDHRSVAKALLTILALIVAATAVPIYIQRRTMRRINAKIRQHADDDFMIGWLVLRDAVTLLISVLVFTVLLLAIVALSGGVKQIEDSGLASAYVAVMLSLGIFTLFAHWFGTSLFAPSLREARVVPMSNALAKRAVWLTTALGAVLGFEEVLEYVEDSSPFSTAASGSASFVLILCTAVPLFLLGMIIRTAHKQEQPAEDADALLPIAGEAFVHSRIEWGALFGRLMQFAAVAAVAVAVIGYISLSRRIILPTIETMAVIFLMVLTYHRLLSIGRLLTRRWPEFAERSSIFGRVVLGAALLILAIPVIAIFWGVRAAEITDFIVLLRDGVEIGNTTISLGTIVTLIGVFAIGYVVTRWIQRILQTALLTRMGINKGTQSALVTGVGYVGLLLSVVAAIAAAGIDLSSMTIVLGALSVGIGFGLQGVVANFVSGIILLLERPVKEGDFVEIGGFSGIISKISVRATRLQAFNHDDVIIPNSELISGVVRNRTFTDNVSRIECAVAVAYDSDVQKAFAILIDVANAHPLVIQDPPPKVVMESLGDSALLLKLYCFIEDVNQSVGARSDLLIAILRELKSAGIEIPFPRQDLTVRVSPGESEAKA